MSDRLGIIADDLSGACDAGVQFSAHGFSTQVRLSSDGLTEAESDIVVVCTASRRLSQESARRKVWETCRRMQQIDLPVCYKKMDSTLLGNVGAEIDAILDNSVAGIAVVAPAFPKMGRRLLEGELILGDGSCPTGTHLPTMLAQQSARRVRQLNRGCVQYGAEKLAATIRKEYQSGNDMLVIDAISDDDLATVAEASMSLFPQALMVGSAGLAAHVAGILSGRRGRAKSMPGRIANLTKPAGQPATRSRRDSHTQSVILFVGSTNPVTQAQLDRLIEAGNADLVRAGRNAVAQATSSMNRNRHLVVEVHSDSEGEARFLGALLDLFGKRPPHAVVLTGGDTAQLVCQLSATSGIELEREIVVGIPRGRFVGGIFDGLPAATKAGGFGNDAAIVEIVNDLAREHGHRPEATATGESTDERFGKPGST
jgi:uncharacterized protein YgbK (DUF1537 family)